MFVAAAAAAGATATDLRSEDPLAGLKAKRPDLHLPTDRPTLEALPADSAPVLGLFAEDHLAYEHHRTSRGLDQPSLAAMTRFAVQRLQASGRPYALVIEAGRIDHAHHEGRAQLALIDTLALSEAVAMADRLTSADDTLIVVTADHGHTLTITGYPARGNPVLGLVRGSDGALSRDLHGRPYTTLSYANGPGATVALDDLASLDTSDTAFRQPALVPLESETHSGEDVAVYARGPGSSAVRGVIEQHVVFHLLAQAQPMLRSAMQEQSAVERSGPMPARPLRASESP
jgi:alkaline phosphatase